MLHFPSPFSRLRVDQLLEPVDYVWSMTTHIPRGMVIGPPRGEKGEESIIFFRGTVRDCRFERRFVIPLSFIAKGATERFK